MKSTGPSDTRTAAAGDRLRSEAEYYEASTSAAPLHFKVEPAERPAALLERLGPPPVVERACPAA